MNNQELIQVNLQLPASALDSLSRLAEQLRLLTASSRQQSAAAQQVREQEENQFFDPERFRTLRQGTDMPGIRQPLAAARAVGYMADAEEAVVQMAAAEPARAVPVHAEVTEEVSAPEGAGCRMDQYPEDPAQAGPPDSSAPDAAEAVCPDMQEGPSAQAVRQELVDPAGEIPVVRTEEERQVSDPQTVRMEPESRIPEAEMVWEQTETWDAVPTAVRAEAPSDIAAPSDAEPAITAGPDMPQSRWTGLKEELAAAGPVPLTVESVSQAFQRDGRRYDNGFPLY